MTIAAIIADKGRDVATLPTGTSVRDAVALLAEKRIGAVLVVEAGAIAGVFSERDLVSCLASSGHDALDWPVEKAMSAPAITVEPATPVLAALGTMTQRRIRHLPVIENGALAGIVSIGDLVKYRIERIEEEASALRDYIQSA